MDKKSPVYIFVTTVNVGTEDEYKVVNLTAEDALDCEDGDISHHEIFQKVKDVTITRTVNVNVVDTIEKE